MKYLKAFISGLAFPAVFLPFIYSLLYTSGNVALRQYPLHLIPLFIPIIFGFWNIIYFWLGNSYPIKNKNTRILFHGALLGLILAFIGVFKIGLPALLFSLTGTIQYLPLIVAPILYALIWRYIVNPLNNILVK